MILTRYMRSAIGGGLMSMAITAAAIYGGYHAYVEYKCPYTISKHQGQYYLVEKSTDQKKRITESFELGSLEQRLSGIFRESKKSVVDAMDKLSKR